MNSDEAHMPIGEAAASAGVAASTLRYWESAGVLEAPQRVGGKRRYDSEALRRIELVSVAKRAGFSLAEVRTMLAGLSERTPPPQIWRRLAARKLPEVRRKLGEAEAMQAILERGIRCECVTIEDCLASFEAGSGTKASRGA
jgi:MerR family transcriptional regulator, redox-sensitive transcriptional activator SoxR